MTLIFIIIKMLVSQQNHFNTEELLLYSEKFSNLTAT